MKICHISDIHFRGIARHKEYTEAFETLFKLLKEKIAPDIIINTGDFFHTKTQGITPEVIERMSWCFNSLASIAPTYSILGNHDGNLTNLSRENVISSIHKAINNPRAILFEDSGNYTIPEFPNVCLNVYSPFDHKNWSKVQPQKDQINIALFHGSVKSAKTDLGWVLETYEASIVDFTKFDFCLLGDIHKQQYLSYRLDEKLNEKPWIAYPGSFIQQNHGEDETKGILVWDIKSPKNWDVKFVPIENKQPFLTIPWINNVPETVEHIKKIRKDKAFQNGTRFRISSSLVLPQIQRKQLVYELKEHYKASEVVFKYEKTSHNIDHFKANGIHISKKRLRNDSETIIKLYEQFINNNSQQIILTEEQVKKASKEIEKYISRLNELDEENEAKTITPWILNSIEFDNLFKYGEGNKIDFTTKEGLVGIFGPNRWGKSSCVAAIMYCLFNATDRGSLRGVDIINQHKNYCSAKACITVAGKDYIIKRSTIKNKRDESKSATKVELFEIDKATGTIINKNEDSRCDTDKQIRQLIGTSEDFFLTTLAAQNDLNRFIIEGSTKRKKYLSKFLEIDIFERLFDFAKEDVNLLSAAVDILSDQELDRQISLHLKSIQNFDAKILKINEKRNNFVAKKESLQLWIGSNEQNAKSVDVESVQKISSLINLKQNEFEVKTNKRDSLKKQIQEKDELIVQVQNELNAANIKELELELQSFQDLKELIQVLQHQLETEKKTLSVQEKTIKKLDLVPCGDSFPNCHYIKDAHHDKEKIDEQRILVENFISKFNETSQRFDKNRIKDITKKIEEYKNNELNVVVLKSQKEKIQETIKRLNSEIDGLNKDKSTLEKQLKDINKKVNLIESEEFKKKKNQLEEIQNELFELDNEKQHYLIEMGASKSQLKKLEEDKEKHKDYLNRVRVYSSIQNAFSKTGIPAMILKTQLPAINAELSKILSTIVDFKIELETDENSNAMDVYMIDEHSKRIIELCSGMEKTICSIVLRVALINLSSLPRPDMFIMDEPFGALDEDNQQKCLELLETLKQYFNSVLIISHETPVKELADQIIEIKNDGMEAQVIA